MNKNHSIEFFDKQFQVQARAGEAALNPFELAALPYLRGRVLDYGCGMGNLAVAAASRGCSVVALDASETAIAHLQQRAARDGLDIVAKPADLRDYDIAEDFDTIVSIGLLMFFDCKTAFRQLESLQARVCTGGVFIINVLIDGTTYMDMFAPAGHCLFSEAELVRRFSGWKILSCETRNFDAPGERVKRFATLITRKP
ncbi:MAG: methyltransferase domain-containing protein [Usitatibacteraceae bacterium]